MEWMPLCAEATGIIKFCTGNLQNKVAGKLNSTQLIHTEIEIVELAYI